MASNDHLQEPTDNDGMDQGKESMDSQGLCDSQVSGCGINPHCQEQLAIDSPMMLCPDRDYIIYGKALNYSLTHAIERFNNESAYCTDRTQPSYSLAFWNGYAAAIQGVIATVTNRTFD